MALDCVKKIDAGLEQIKLGLAWHYKKYQGEQSEEDRLIYSEAEKQAISNKVGWGKNEESMPPWEWRQKNKRGKIN